MSYGLSVYFLDVFIRRASERNIINLSKEISFYMK
jgi:hypothetical protein